MAAVRSGPSWFETREDALLTMRGERVVTNSTRRPRPAQPLDPPKSAFGRRRLAKPGQITSDCQKSCQAPKSKRIKNIPLHNSGNQNYNLRHPGPHEGRFAIVTMRWAGDAVDALASGVFFAPDENAKAYGEVVWSWRRDAGAKLLRSKLLRGDGGKQARSPGRARSKP